MKPLTKDNIEKSVATSRAPALERQLVRYPDQLKALSLRFDRLAERSVDQNGFFLPPVVEAAWKHIFKWFEGAEVVLYWSLDSDGERKDLVGFLPLAYGATRWAGVPIIDGFSNYMCFQGTPYIDSRFAEHVLTQFLKDEKRRWVVPHAIRFRWIPTSGKFKEHFEKAAENAGWSTKIFAEHKRAFLDTTKDAQQALLESLSSSKRRKLRRYLRRLEEQGEIKFDIVSDAKGIDAALQEFLTLEASGWKGKAGTAISCKENWTRYFEELITGLAPNQHCKFYRLYCGDVLLASALLVHAGEGAWCWKIAFNESYASYSPGMLLVKFLTRQLCEDPKVAYADSCSVPGNTLTETIWSERLDMADIFAAPSTGQMADFIFAMEQYRISLRNTLKKAKNAAVKQIKRVMSSKK